MIRRARAHWRDIKTRQAKQFMAAALQACKVGFGVAKRHSQTIEIVAVTLGLAILGGSLYWQHLHRYDTTPQARQLLPKVSVDTSKIKLAHGVVDYNAATDGKDVKNKVVVADPTDATNGTSLYEASLATDPSKGLTFSQASSSDSTANPASQIPNVQGLPAGAHQDSQPDRGGNLSFRLTPLGGGVQQGRYVSGRLQYPSSGGQRFYTFRKNGIAEDILLTKAPNQGTVTYQWRLDLPNSLEARMLPTGGIGIYSANPELFGNIQVGDAKSQALLDKARKNGQKNTLAFVLPAPFIKSTNGTTDYTHTKFTLSKDNILTLTATSLKKLSYPLSIDPSVVVPTNSAFYLGYDDGMIDYTTNSPNQITRANISGGAVGGWNYTYNGNSCATFSASPCSSGGFNVARDGHTSVAYNGYLYIMGGYDGTTYHNDVQYALLCTGSNNGVGGCGSTAGAIGTWNYTYNGNSCATTASPCNGGFGIARSSHTSVVYNGYMYIVGGFHNANDTACNVATSFYCNDVQYALICTGSNNGVGGCSSTAGTLGTWNYTYNGNSCATFSASPCSSGGFNVARYGHTSVVYNGYMYILGGAHDGLGNLCSPIGSQYCADVEYAPINANGTVGTWNNTYNGNSCATFSAPCNGGFTTARYGQTSVAYNGYLYVIGGYHGSNDTACNGTTSQLCDDVQYAPINANGTIGAWNYTYNGNSCATFSASPCSSGGFTTGRDFHTSVAANGYMYVIGGFDGTSYHNDLQYAAINANGTVGTWNTTTSFTTSRHSQTSVAYNGYMYVLGGLQSASNTACNGATNTVCDDVQYTQIQPMGTAGPSIDKSAAFTTARFGQSSVVYNGYLYIIGGCSAASGFQCSTFKSDIQYCPLNADGTIGTCQANATGFTTGRLRHTSVIYNGYLYVIGGCAAMSSATCTTLKSDIQYCQINTTNGTVGSCTTNTNSLLVTSWMQSAVVYNGYLLVVDGDTTGGSYNDVGSIETCQFGASGVVNACNYTCNGITQGTTCTALRSTSLSEGLGVTIHNGYLYIIAYLGASATNTVQFCLVNTSGAVGTCNYTCNGTNNAGTQCGAFGSHNATNAAVVIYNDTLYVVGGGSCQGSGCDFTDVYHCPLNTNGTVGSCTDQSTELLTPRDSLSAIINNGYIYAVGGENANSGSPVLLSDIERFWIGQMGQVGANTQQSGAFTSGRYGQASVVYKGYLYITGGYDGTNRYNDIQYAAINSNGSLSCPSSATCTGGTVFAQQNNAFTNTRYFHDSVAYNGYLYIIAGQAGSNVTSCNVSGYCTDVQYCPLNANGSIGDGISGNIECSQQTSMLAAGLAGPSSVAYNGYLYVMGGAANSAITGCSGSNPYQCSNIQYAPFCTAASTPSGCPSTNWQGAVGSFTQQSSAFTTGRQYTASVIYNGYLYIVGGYNGTPLNDIQYAPFCTAASTPSGCPSTNWQGAVGSFTQQLGAFSNVGGSGRYGHATIVYDGYLYILGGWNGGSNLNDAQYCPISSTRWVGACGYLASAFTTGREYPSANVYNGYVYIMGGTNGTAQSDVQYMPLSVSPQLADYEKTLDTGTAIGTIQSISYSANSGTDLCGEQLWYATAGSNGQFGSWAIISPAYAGTTYTINAANQEYVLAKVVMDDQTCGGQSNVTAITVNYVVPPTTPTLTAPASGATDLNSVTPSFQLSSTQGQSHNLQYKLKVCDDQSLSVNCQNIDGTASSTGWVADPTASGATAQFNGISTLSWGHTYWWAGQAYDATDLTNFSAWATAQSFTTSYVPSAPTLTKPTASAIGVSTTPELRFYSTDQDNDYLEYKILICASTDSSCSSPLQTILQTSTQAGWTSQNQHVVSGSPTAYSSGQTAIYTAQTALSANTQYYWEVFAIDPGGSNTYSTGSSIGTFTTGVQGSSAQNTVHIGGGNVNIGGNVIIKP